MTNVAPSLTIESRFEFGRGARGRKCFRMGDTDAPPMSVPLGRIPRISRLMALALRFEQLLASGEVRDFAELASLGQVTRARLTQIMNLRLLAPSIQEDILFLPLVEHGREPVKEWMVRPIAATQDWRKQRRLWADLKASLPT